MKIDFTKMKANGNVYIVTYFKDGMPDSPESISKGLLNENILVGSDGVVFVTDTKTADAKMQLFSSDGIEVMPCVNSLRCLGKFIYDKGIIDSPTPLIETVDGYKRFLLHIEEGKVKTATICLGNAVFSDPDGFVQTVNLCGSHRIVFTDDLSEIPEEYGDMSLNLVKVNGRRSLSCRSINKTGIEALSVGNGLCAAVASAVKNGSVDTDTPIFANSPDGSLVVVCSSGYDCYVTGMAEFISHGTASI